MPVLALYYAAPWLHLAEWSAIVRQELFTGMLVYDTFTVFMRAFLLLFAILFAVFTRLSRNPAAEDAVDFYCLVLGGTLGMCLMASANHLLMVFLAVEMASVPSYALAGQQKTRRKSSEAALKYSIYGAGAAGIMLYGISLLGRCAELGPSAHDGRATLRTHAGAARRTEDGAGAGRLDGHGRDWRSNCRPCRFTSGARTCSKGPVRKSTPFLSVASKAGALALLVRVAIGLGVVPADRIVETAVAVTQTVARGRRRCAADAGHRCRRRSESAAAASSSPYGTDPLAPVRQYHRPGGGSDCRRDLHVRQSGRLRTDQHQTPDGLLDDRACRLHDAGHSGRDRRRSAPARKSPASAIAGLALYIAVYLLMNLGAFAIIAFYRNALGSEEISVYSGLVRRSPIHGRDVCPDPVQPGRLAAAGRIPG